MILSQGQVQEYANESGFSGNAILLITAIAYAESGFDTDAVNTEGNTPPSRDRGLVQINDYWHKEISDACAFDPLCAMQSAYTISSQGTNFNPWATYTSGEYQSYYRKELAMSEVAAFEDVSQFYPGKTEFACGFYTAGALKYAGQNSVQGTPSQIEQWADAQYVQEYGSDGANMTGGVSIDDEHRLIQAAGCNYNDLPMINPNSLSSSDYTHVKASIEQLYPVVVTVLESSIFDIDLGRNPYWWGASGTHVLLITGLDSEGNYLCRDSANVIGSLQGPNNPQPGPRRYDPSKMAIQWATMAVMSWLPQLPSNYDPTQPSPKGTDEMLPTITWSKLPTGDVLKQAEAIYNDDTTWNSGIADCYKRMFANGVNCGSALGTEISTIDLSGQQTPIKVRMFSQGVRIEYNTSTNKPRAFTLTQEFKFQ